MKALLNELLVAVITVCIPIISAYAVKLVKKTAENISTDTDDIKVKGYIKEIAEAISTAVSYTSQTYVDALKAAGTFTVEAQKEAFQKSLDTALSILSPAAAAFIDEVYGDIREYLAPLIEAEVRKQKALAPVEIAPAMTLETAADTTTVAATTAAATAATIAQTAIHQIKAEAGAVAAAGPEAAEAPGQDG